MLSLSARAGEIPIRSFSESQRSVRLVPQRRTRHNSEHSIGLWERTPGDDKFVESGQTV